MFRKILSTSKGIGVAELGDLANLPYSEEFWSILIYFCDYLRMKCANWCLSLSEKKATVFFQNQKHFIYVGISDEANRLKKWGLLFCFRRRLEFLIFFFLLLLLVYFISLPKFFSFLLLKNKQCFNRKPLFWFHWPWEKKKKFDILVDIDIIHTYKWFVYV